MEDKIVKEQEAQPESIRTEKAINFKTGIPLEAVERICMEEVKIGRSRLTFVSILHFMEINDDDLNNLMVENLLFIYKKIFSKYGFEESRANYLIDSRQHVIGTAFKMTLSFFNLLRAFQEKLNNLEISAYWVRSMICSKYSSSVKRKISLTDIRELAIINFSLLSKEQKIASIDNICKKHKKILK